jgi:hypothetical protein
MSRYAKYFLRHLLCVEDTFSRYYVQDDSWGRQDILDVEYIIFDWEEEAEDWLAQCIEFDRSTTLDSLRHMLAYDCLTAYQVHRMNDSRVVRTVAGELCMNAWRIVIEPKIGWTVRVDANTRAPVQPVAEELDSDIDGMLAELKTYLDAIVDEAKEKNKQHQAALSGKNSAEVALYYSENAGDAVYQDQAVGTWDILVSVVKKFPGFYKGFLKFHWKLFTLPATMAEKTALSIHTGNLNPLKEEIDKIVDPVVLGYDKAMHYKSLLTVLLSDPETYDLLWDFAQRYYDASHPVELTRLGATVAGEIIVTILLALVSYGAGAVANIAAKSTRLAKVAELLEKLALAIRKSKRVSALIGDTEEAVAETGKTARRIKKGLKDMPEIDNPKTLKKLEHEAQEGYDKVKKIDGPKTIPKITGDKGTVVNVDGNNIYDPSYPSLSSKSRAQSRFSDPSYRSNGGDVYPNVA